MVVIKKTTKNGLMRKDMVKGVITADIIGSTRIPDEIREQLPSRIEDLAKKLDVLTPLNVEIFRGDSFQIAMDDASKSALVAILFRAGLIMMPMISERKSIDARMSIGIGDVRYSNERIALSDGSAFVNSGREFESLKKRRLAVKTPDKCINDELAVTTPFVDDIISHWSIGQSEMMYGSLYYNEKQFVLAERYKTSQQNVAKKLSAAKESLVRLYIERVEYLIKTTF